MKYIDLPEEIRKYIIEPYLNDLCRLDYNKVVEQIHNSVFIFGYQYGYDDTIITTVEEVCLLNTDGDLYNFLLHFIYKYNHSNKKYISHNYTTK